MKYLSAALLCDFYKLSHRAMYPEGTEVVYSTWTPRTSRVNGVEHVVNFGTQAALMKLVELFDENFFSRPKAEVVAEYARIIKHTLGTPNPETKHLEELHDLGYLPLSVKALPEGAVVPLRVPTLTVQNTDPRFFWLTNYIETFLSCELWQSSTSATIAYEYRKLLDRYSLETTGSVDGALFQGHDFSMRGMSSLESAVLSGMGHLLSFPGTDTVPAIQGAEHFYGANVEKELVGTSIPATEHSIQCAYGDDLAYLKRMITEVHPNGFVSVVSDGYDYWDVVSRITKELKADIMARDGRLVIRPDSGDPVKIVCGDPEAAPGTPEFKGSIQVLWEIFGGTEVQVNHNNGDGTWSLKKYKVLDSHIGLIYGDAITLRRAEEICERLRAKGFASINVVFGIGSYTYQYNTRDTFGYAMKSTLCVVKGEERQIFKNPKTDDGTKKSQKGRVIVLKDHPQLGKSYTMHDGFGLNDFSSQDELKEVFRDGKLLVKQNFEEIRARLKKNGS